MSLSANKSPKLLGNVIYQDTMTSNYLKEGNQDHHCDTHSNDKGTLRAFDQVFILEDLIANSLLDSPYQNLPTTVKSQFGLFQNKKNIWKFATQPNGS